MTVLGEHAARYVAVRRALGYKLCDVDRLLEGLVEQADRTGCDHLDVDVVLAWAATAPSDRSHARRLSVARRFAAYLKSFDPATQTPPVALGPGDSYRQPPYIYSASEITALMTAARHRLPTVSASSAATLIGLTAACGLRPAEVYKLRCGDVDLHAGRLAVMDSKDGRSRLLPLDPSTTDALARHLRIRRTANTAERDALFVTARLEPVESYSFSPTFRQLIRATAITAPPGRRPPRLGDLRHTFAGPPSSTGTTPASTSAGECRPCPPFSATQTPRRDRKPGSVPTTV